MKMLIPIAASTLAILAALFSAGCETDNSTPKVGAVPLAEADVGVAPAGVNTVKVVIDSSPPNATITLNGLLLGYTPSDAHLRVDADARLLDPVELRVAYGTGSLREGTTISARTADGAHRYEIGERVPARIEFYGNSRVESPKPAPWDTKPTEPSTKSVEQNPGR